MTAPRRTRAHQHARRIHAIWSNGSAKQIDRVRAIFPALYTELVGNSRTITAELEIDTYDRAMDRRENRRLARNTEEK